MPALDALWVVNYMKRIAGFVVLSLWISVLFAGCLNDSTGFQGDDYIWVGIEPIQCLGNTWERDWLDKHNWDYAGYPRDLAAQFEIIKAYYEDLGVDVRALATRKKYSIVCCACSCARGDTLYIMVRAQDFEIMEKEGYRRERPSMPGPIIWFH